MYYRFVLQTRKDFLQLMLNSHKETVDKEDKDQLVDYKGGESKWKNRGSLCSFVARDIIKTLDDMSKDFKTAVTMCLVCRLRSIATHRDHFVRRLSVRLCVCPSVRLSYFSVTLFKAMFRRRHMHSSECCHFFIDYTSSMITLV